MNHQNRCSAHDGNEQCCLVKTHPLPHMGRWYTMRDEDIVAEVARRLARPAVRL